MLVLFTTMFALGLATSTHCVGMCGPMVVTYAVKGDDDGSWRSKLVPNLVYQFTKLLSYVTVGVILGAIGSTLNLKGIAPWATLVAGVFMVILGLGMTGRVPWAARLTPRPPKFLIASLSRLRRKATDDAAEGTASLATPAAFGLLTGLMPCAPLQGAELAAAASGSALTGGVGMLAFGLGTFPLLFAFGTASSLIPRAWKHRLNIALAIVVIVFGLVFLNRAAMLTGFPINASTIRAALVGSTTTTAAPAYTTAADGVVEVPLTIRNTQYVPSTITIPAGKAVRIIVDRQEDVACSNALVLPQLGVNAPLADNAVTAVSVPPTKAGTYTMTCGMGMMSGVLVASGSGGSAASGSPILWLLLAVVAAATALYFTRRRSAAVSTKGSQAATAAPVATILGLSPTQIVITVAAIAVALIVGLVLGGYFT